MWSPHQFWQHSTPRRFIIVMTVLGGILMLPLLLLPSEPGNDTAHYYCRMAAALVRGDWSAAFYHMIPPLFPLLTGIVAKFGLPPFAAAKVVSCAFFTLGIPAIYLLFRKVSGDRIARWSVVLYMISPRLLRYSGNGGPDSAKMFLLLMLMLILVKYLRTDRIKWLAPAGACGGLAALVRSECLFLVLAAIGFTLATRLVMQRRHGLMTRVGWTRLAGGGVLFLVTMLTVLSPWIAYQKHITGYYLTDSRELRVLARFGVISHDDLAEFQHADLDGITRNRKLHDDGLIAPFIETAKGLMLPYLALAAIGLWLTWRHSQRWSVENQLLIITVLLNFILFFTISGYVTKRYIAPTQPLLLGFAGHGLLFLGTWLSNHSRHGRRLAITAFAIFAVIGVADGYIEIRPSLRPEKRRAEAVPREIAAYIAENRAQLITGEARPLRSTKQWYHDGQLPVVVGSVTQVAYYGQVDLVSISKKYFYTPQAFLHLCQDNDADLVLVNEKVTTHCIDIDQLLNTDRRFTPLRQWRVSGSHFELYRFQPDPGQTPGLTPPPKPDSRKPQTDEH